MKLFHWGIAIAMVATVAIAATAQNQAAKNQAPAANVSPAQAAIARAAKANKYLLLFCWETKDQKTNDARAVFEPAAAKLADSAAVVSIQINDAAEQQIVDQYDLTRSPMPLVLSIAPNGAITKGFSKTFDEKELRTAFVSRGTQLCMKALQDRKLVLVCAVDPAGPKGPMKTPKCAEGFKADAKYGPATEIILVNAKDQREASFLKDLKIDQSQKPMVAFFAPPAVWIGNFDGAAAKDELVAKLVAAQSSCCPGGKCGPGGCK
jgi:hypothetical protein